MAKIGLKLYQQHRSLSDKNVCETDLAMYLGEALATNTDLLIDLGEALITNTGLLIECSEISKKVCK